MRKHVKQFVYQLLFFMFLATTILGFPAPASASTISPLKTLTAGNTVNFAGYTWVVLNPNTGYLLMQGIYNDGHDYQFDSNNRQVFSGSSIEYLLNTTFYNSLPTEYTTLIQTHDWDVKAENGVIVNGSSATVSDHIGLLSYNDWKTYSIHYNSGTGGFLDNPSAFFWTLTPNDFNQSAVYYTTSQGLLDPTLAANSCYVRPALYLNSDILVSGGNGGTVLERTPTPTITTPVLVGATNVSGTAVAGASIELSVNGGPQWTVNADGSGNWTVSGLAPLNVGNAISVTATAIGNNKSNPATATSAATIDIKDIAGVTAPVTGATPVSALADTTEYTATISWSSSPTKFAPSTVYTATITLTPKTGYTLTGVAANYFKVAGATTSNSAGSGVVTAVFPATAAAPINTAAIAGVTAPVTGAIPVPTITATSEYTATISWLPTGATFAPSTAYTATITITPKAGYTLTGVAANFFTVAGATTVTNSAGSGVVTAVFPATAAPYIPPTWYAVYGVSLDKTTLILSVGEAPSTLIASVQPNYASYPAVTWSSSEPSVASVNGGVVTPLTPGKTTITVTTCDGGITASCLVEVKAAVVSVSGISLDRSSLLESLAVGQTEQLTVTITPDNATDKTVTWSVSSQSGSNVLTVSPIGLVTAANVGTAVIRATSNADATKYVECSVTVTVDNSAKDITDLIVANQIGNSTIDIANHAVSFHMPYSTRVKRLKPTIIVSAGATISPKSKAAKNFTDPVIYTVTAQDGTIQTWTVTCVVEPRSSAKDITGFTVPKQVGSSTIDTTSHTISFHMPYCTSVKGLKPTIIVSAGATISPKSKAAKNFTDPVIYTVTAQDGTIQTWTVTCVVDPRSSAKDITGFTVPKQVGSSTIDTTSHTVSFHMPYGTSVKGLKPTIILSAGATISPKSKAAKNFTDPVIYTVTAQDGMSQDWRVICIVDPKL